MHRRRRGGERGYAPPKFLENIVILCVERRFSKQNSVIRLKSNICPPKFFGPPNFWAGYATATMAFKTESKEICPALLFSQSVVGQFTPPKWWRLAHAHSKERKDIPTQLLQFHVKFMCMSY